MPTEAYSNLEVLQNDHQANSPQRDPAKYPPELDTAVLAPQVKKNAKSNYRKVLLIQSTIGLGPYRSRGSIRHILAR